MLFWNGDIHTFDRKFALFNDNEEFSGNLLKTIMKSNGTIRVFDEIGRRKHEEARKKGRKLRTDKTYLFSDYSKPHPVPVDFYRKAGISTDYQWIILSQKNTGEDISEITVLIYICAGTHLHVDPDFTSPWNSVISGYKW